MSRRGADEPTETLRTQFPHRLEPHGARPLSRSEVLVVAALAAAPRALGLGHASLWLDEILGTMQASGGFWEGLAAIRADRVHPPAWFLLDWSWLQVSAAEPWRRLLPAALGVLTVLLLADLAGRWFGRKVALTVALLASLAPFHVRYSQELRPYSLALCCFVLTLGLVDRARRSESTRSWMLVALGLVGCIATLYLDVLVVAPMLLLVLDPHDRPGRWRARLGRLAGATGAALLPMLPWLSVARAALAKTHELQPTQWDLDLLWRRWQFLTLAGREGERGNVLSLVVALVVLLGAAAALRSHPGRVTLLGFVAGSVGVELALAAAGHWSNGRYSVLAWPFLVLLLGLGCNACREAAAWLGRRWGATGHAASWGAVGGAIATAGLGGLALGGLLDYYRHGRPDWQGAAAAIESLGPDVAVLASNEWTRVSLGYYLAGGPTGGSASFPGRLRTLPAGQRIAELGLRESCVALVEAGYPQRADLEPLVSATPIRVPLRRTDARIVVLARSDALEPGGEVWRCSPPSFETTDWERRPPFTGEQPSPIDSRNPETARLELDGADEGALLAGWSYPEQSRDGTTFRWALGTWASFRIEAPTATRIRFAAWPFGDSQEITLFRNHAPVGTLILRKGNQSAELALPELETPTRKDVFHLRFSRHASPGENPRSLAAAFDRIELVP